MVLRFNFQRAMRRIKNLSGGQVKKRQEKRKIKNVFYIYDQTEILIFSQPVITCSNLTMETLEQGLKYVRS